MYLSSHRKQRRHCKNQEETKNCILWEKHTLTHIKTRNWQWCLFWPAAHTRLAAPEDGVCPPGCQCTHCWVPWVRSEPGACCQTAPLDPFGQGCSPGTHSSPSLCSCLALLRPRCRVQHFDLLNFIPLINAQCSNLSRTLCKASHPLKSTTTSQLDIIKNLLIVHSAPASSECKALELSPEEHCCWPTFLPWKLTTPIDSKRPSYYLYITLYSLYLKKSIVYPDTAQDEEWK